MFWRLNEGKAGSEFFSVIPKTNSNMGSKQRGPKVFQTALREQSVGKLLVYKVFML